MMISERKKAESYDEEIRNMLVKAVEVITVSDEIKLKIKKRIEAEIDSCNKVGRQNKSRS